MLILLVGGPRDGEQLEVDETVEHVEVRQPDGAVTLVGQYNVDEDDPNQWVFRGFLRMRAITYSGGPHDGEVHEIQEGFNSAVVMAEGAVAGQYQPVDDAAVFVFRPVE